MCATGTPLTATISSSTRSRQSSAGLPEEGWTGVRKMKIDKSEDGRNIKEASGMIWLAPTERRAAIQRDKFAARKSRPAK